MRGMLEGNACTPRITKHAEGGELRGIFLAATVVLWGATPALATSYTAFLLPGAAGEQGVANAINNSDDIAGDLTNSVGTLEGVIWSPTGTITPLQDMGGGLGTQAVGINNSGYAVGYSAIASWYNAVVWAQMGRGLFFRTLAAKDIAKLSQSTTLVTLLAIPKLSKATKP
jgi:hypothetical protein